MMNNLIEMVLGLGGNGNNDPVTMCDDCGKVGYIPIRANGLCICAACQAKREGR